MAKYEIKLPGRIGKKKAVIETLIAVLWTSALAHTIARGIRVNAQPRAPPLRN